MNTLLSEPAGKPPPFVPDHFNLPPYGCMTGTHSPTLLVHREIIVPPAHPKRRYVLALSALMVPVLCFLQSIHGNFMCSQIVFLSIGCDIDTTSPNSSLLMGTQRKLGKRKSHDTWCHWWDLNRCKDLKKRHVFMDQLQKCKA